ncbi:MAG: chloride channel protein [Chloroflexota bacterium]
MSGAEDLFQRLPVHWMWWPAQRASWWASAASSSRVLGVGYDSIAAMLRGSLALQTLALLLVVKLVIWSVALGSGTSEGILAPLLIIRGRAREGILAPLLPDGSSGIWALVCMSATLARGSPRCRSPRCCSRWSSPTEQGLLLPLLLMRASPDTR